MGITSIRWYCFCSVRSHFEKYLTYPYCCLVLSVVIFFFFYYFYFTCSSSMFLPYGYGRHFFLTALFEEVNLESERVLGKWEWGGSKINTAESMHCSTINAMWNEFQLFTTMLWNAIPLVGLSGKHSGIFECLLHYCGFSNLVFSTRPNCYVCKYLVENLFFREKPFFVYKLHSLLSLALHFSNIYFIF